MIKRQQKGFTIVELLVVIVVIGILAAVTIVSFNGIRTRAENTKTISGIEQFANTLRIYQSDNGEFPLVSYNGFLYYCIADAGQSCALISGSGAACGNVTSATGNNILNDLIKTVTPKIPELSNQDMNCEGKTVRGAFYYTLPNDRSVYIAYYLKGDQTCVTPAGSALSGRIFYSNGGTTVCTLNLVPS